MPAKYLHDLGDDVLALRRPAEEHLRRGALMAFGVPVALLAGFWAPVLLLGPGSPWVWLGGGLVVSLLAAVCALAGAALLVTARKRAQRDLVRVDLAERWIERGGAPAEVLRTPDAVVVRRRRLGWELGLRSGRAIDVLLAAPRSSGRALVGAAEALAEHLDVEAQIDPAARGAGGLVPARKEAWAALLWSPLDGANLAYAVWALWTSDDAWLRANARHALAHLVVEAVALALVAAALTVPTLALDAAPAAVLLLLILPLGGAYAVRAGLRSYVAYRAHAGERWPAPWLGWLFAPKPSSRPPSPPPPSAGRAPPRAMQATQVGAPW